MTVTMVMHESGLNPEQGLGLERQGLKQRFGKSFVYLGFHKKAAVSLLSGAQRVSKEGG